MRITLDYYRILSVPIKADLAQIKRAYEDRLQQQARREYSAYAIAARKQILKQAYSVLSNPETKAEYDQGFFAEMASESYAESGLESTATTTKSVTVNPYIEIEPELISGALIILYELAEYEMIIHLGTDYLNQQLEKTTTQQLETAAVNSDGNDAVLEEIDHKPDILFCLALSYLELSREHWHRQEWEQAAVSGQMGLKMLQQEQSLFPSLQAEIQSDLDLLKPYRILDLLAHENVDSVSRATGITLLQEMLQQREGISGKKKAPSGLKSDQFLCFIQQIRTYLTLSEQKAIFLAEAQRGSALGSCIAAYTLIAEGYTQKKPDSIVKAKQIFQKLSLSQDTHKERAICALLLGQTAESQAIIQQHPDTSAFEVISRRSQYSPDLIPGIYFYAEKWLQTEVLSQFKNLDSQGLKLRDYFDDPQVQQHLNAISPVANRDRSKQSSDSINHKSTARSEQEKTRLQQLFPWLNKKKDSLQTSSAASTPVTRSSVAKTTALVGAGASVHSQSHSHVVGNQYSSLTPENDHQYQAIKLPKAPTSHYHFETNPQLVSPSVPPTNSIASSPTAKSAARKQKTKPAKRKKAASKNYGKKGLLLLGLMGGLAALGFVITKSLLDDNSEPLIVESTKVEDPLPTVANADDAPSVSGSAVAEQPSPTEPATTATALNTESAQKSIQQWLDSKKAALGQQHQIDALNSILTAPALTQWRNIAAHYQQNEIYRQFDHTLKINSVDIDPNNSDVATVEAAITETAQHYQQGKLNQAQSYNSDLLVRYELVRQNNNWLIKNSQVLKNQ